MVGDILPSVSELWARRTSQGDGQLAGEVGEIPQQVDGDGLRFLAVRPTLR
jgi:hypothetical protein